ncbi:lytic transglycosylase domain-containing protein [Salmonella enterica subsp. enterica serovar Winslow]|nr:hypothetical protein [Salmonella enterica subsp. enterica serovar Livingstone]
MKSLTLKGAGVLLLLWLFSPLAQAYCFAAAGARYHIDPLLLQAIAIHESRLNQRAIGVNKSKSGRILSRDVGVMQINSGHIPELQRLGIINSVDDLLDNPCLNVQVGAWILARDFHRCGVSWQCLGSYNASSPAIGLRYAKEIWAIYRRLLGQQVPG